MPDVRWRVERFGQLSSTQDELRRRLKSGEPVAGLVIRTAEQTAGRGQRQRDWLSGPGGSWQSAALKGPVLPAAGLFIAIGVAQALNGALSTNRLQLKWPNDLLLAGSKAGGLLCESSSGHLLAGVGVNVRNEVPPGAARLEELEPAEVDELVLRGISSGWQLMHSRSSELPALWAPLDALAGQQLELRSRGKTIRGTAAGVDATGRLRLLSEAGEKLLDSAAELRGPLRRSGN